MSVVKKTAVILFIKRFAILAAIEAPLLLCGLYLLFVAAFSGSSFYPQLLLVAWPTLAISVGVFIFLPRLRRFAKIFYPLLALCILTPIIIRSIYFYFDDKIPVLYDGVNITAYQPFSPSLPRLPEKAALQLEDDLPVLDGALALYPVYSAFATAVYPEKDYSLTGWYGRGPSRGSGNAYYDGEHLEPGEAPHEVHFTNTVWGFHGLLDGRVDIYFMAEISEEQKALAAQNGIELIFTPIGREAFVFFVNAENPVDSATVEQIRGIYSGRITRWEELGGKGTIKPFQRGKDSGSQSALERLMQGERLLEPPTTEEPAGMGGIIREVANYKNYSGAIGFSFRFFSTQMTGSTQIKLLKINGVEPDIENIKSGAYPLSSSFYAITRKDNDNPNIQKFLDFMTSDQGQYLVEQVGYVPVRGAN